MRRPMSMTSWLDAEIHEFLGAFVWNIGAKGGPSLPSRSVTSSSIPTPARSWNM